MRTDRHFIETPAFEGWLEKNGVYCSLIDIPRLSSNGKTCLLTYEPATVSDGYVKALTNGTDIADDDVRVIEANRDPAAAKEMREVYEFVTGEPYTTPDAAQKWLQENPDDPG